MWRPGWINGDDSLERDRSLEVGTWKIDRLLYEMFKMGVVLEDVDRGSSQVGRRRDTLSSALL